MKYLKYTAWIILSFLVLFFGSEAYKSVRAHYALIKAEELANYGPEGKPKSETPIDWNAWRLKNWKGRHINISGIIPEGRSYEIEVSYFAESESSSCKEGFLFGPFKKGKFYNYKPEIIKGKHRLRIPLDEVNPNKGCRYRLHSVSMALANKVDNVSYILFHPLETNPENSIVRINKYRQVINNILDIECALSTTPADAEYFSGCYQAPIQDHVDIAQEITPSYTNSNYEVNIKFLSVNPGGGYKR